MVYKKEFARGPPDPAPFGEERRKNATPEFGGRTFSRGRAFASLPEENYNGRQAAHKGEEGVGEIRIGICAWEDRGLRESGWYPSSLRGPGARLGYYGGRFDTVEVDSAFYALPREEWIFRWVSRTPPGFLFNVKAFGLFTWHRVPVRNLPPWARSGLPPEMSRVTLDDLPREIRVALWERFVQALMPLHRMDRMGYLLFQFPPWVRPGGRMEPYVRRLAELARPLRLAVEVRHRSWWEDPHREPFLDLLRRENVAYVAVDEPELPWTLPPEWPRTASWGTVVRFHGRAAEAWNRPGASVEERFRYRYASAELLPWRDRIRTQSSREGRIFVMFNNCGGDGAVRGAAMLKSLLGLAPLEEGGEQQRLPGQ